MSERLPRRFREFAQDHEEVWSAYESLGAAAASSGPLDEQTRELVKLAMAAAMRAESAVHSHTHRALDTGASEEAVIQTVMLGVTTIGFPAMMTALTWTKAAIAAHE
jgi:4-carboxymuconolactone decarboxylase